MTPAPLAARLPSRRGLLQWLPVALLLGGAAVGPQGPSVILVGLLGALLGVVALVLGLRRVRQAPPGRLRQAWVFVLLAVVLQNLVGATYSGQGLEAQSSGTRTLVTFVLRNLLNLALLLAVLSFPAAHRGREQLLTLAADLTMVGGSALLGLWYFIVGPVVVAGPGTDVPLLPTLVAVGDCVVVGGALFVLLRGITPSARRSVRLLCGAVALLAAPDLALAYVSVHSGAADRDLPASMWLVTAAMWLFVLAVLPPRGADAVPDAADHALSGGGDLRPWQESALPYACVILGFGLLLWAASTSPLYPWGGLALGAIVMTGSAVVRQIVALEQNRRRAFRDPLTGAVNRAGLMAALDRFLPAAARRHRPVAVALMDLDGFKAINDTYGHEAGDEALVAFAEVLTRQVRVSDVVGRLGGDEFVLVLTRVQGLDDAVLVAERILDDLAEPRTIAGVPLRLRSSIGLTLTSDPSDTPAQALARADAAMYEAKRAGGSCWRAAGVDASTEP